MADEPINIPIRADTENAEQGFKRVSGGLRDMSRIGTAAIAGLSGGVLAAAGAVKTLADSTTGYVDKVNTLAKGTGLANETIAGLNQVARATGKTLEQLVPKDLALKMLQAEQGSSRALKAFGELGLSQQDVIDLNGDADRTFRVVIDRLQGIDSEGRRAAVASQLLGENGKQLLSALESSDALDQFVDQAREFGIDVGPKAVEQTARWQKANADLALALEQVQSKMSPLIDGASAFVESFSTGIVFISGLLQGFRDYLQDVADRMQALRNLDFGTAMAGQMKGPVDVIKSGVDAIREWREASKGMPPVKVIDDSVPDPPKKIRQTTEAVRELGVELSVAGESAQTLFGKGLVAGADALNVRIAALKEAAMAASMQVGMSMASTQVMSEQAMEGERASFTARQKMRDADMNRDTAALNSSLSIIQQQTNFALQNINTRTKAGKAAAIALFVTQKAAAIAQAVINTALAVSSALTIPPAPVGIALAAVMGALGAVQVGVIAAETPKFHIGSRATDAGPDEYQALLRRNEKVVTAIGDEAMTASRTADLNAGVHGGGMVVAQVVIDHKAAGQIVGTQLRAGTQLMGAVRNGEPRGHSRKRGTRGV